MKNYILGTLYDFLYYTEQKSETNVQVFDNEWVVSRMCCLLLITNKC